MKKLTLAFLKIFFRNRRAMFFVIFLPAGIFLLAALLGLENVIRFDLSGLSYADFLLAGIIAFALMNTGIYTIAYMLVDYQRTNVLKRLFLTPLKARQFFTAQAATRFLIGLIQAGVLVLIGVLFFESGVELGLLWLPLIVLSASVLFLGFGFLIAGIARDYEEAAPYTSVVGLTLTFFGDVFFPASSLPDPLPQIASYLPLKPVAELLRYSLLGTRPNDFVFTIVVVLSWLAVLMVLASWIFSRKVYRQTN